jgi:GNAT superfamily N-acetyltransferase
MTLQVRLASVADVPAMHRVRLGVRENRLSDPRKITEASYPPYVEANSAWVADTGGVIVGFALIEGGDRHVEALFVAPDSEGLGVGRALHAAMLDWAKAQGIDELWLTTSKGTRAERFYATAGWQMVDLLPNGEVRLHKTIR